MFYWPKNINENKNVTLNIEDWRLNIKEGKG